jgi:type II secretory pathway component PulM
VTAPSLPSLAPGLASAWERWSARERTLVALALAVVVLGAGYSWLWRPMTSDIARMTRDLPAAQGALAAARAQADSLAALQRSAASPKAGDPRAAVERALAERNLRPAVSLLDVADGRVRLTFAAVRFDALPDFVASLARSDGLRVSEATLTARVEPGTVRAEFTFTR